LTSNTEYIQRVKNTTNNRIRYDINFQLLTDFFCNNWLQNPYELINLKALWEKRLEELILISYKKIEKLWFEKYEDILNSLWLYLSEEDKVTPADLIFWFWWWWQARYDKCINLYKQWYAKKILFSWNVPFDAQFEQVPEYEYFYSKAKEDAIPDDSIILEKTATNTLENVVFGVKILKDMHYVPYCIILVNLPFTMRRSYYTLKANVDRPCTIIRVCAQWKYTKENRYKTYDGYKFVLYEYMKMYGARLMGHI